MEPQHQKEQPGSQVADGHPAADLPESARPPALEMIDVTVGSLANTAEVVLKGVNWKVAVGDYWAIGGLQASGKSDLLATAAGIMPPVHGVFRVFGQELGAGFEHELMPTRLRLGLVFDGGRPFSHLTVAENVALPIRYHQSLGPIEAKARAEALLEVTGLAAWGHRAPSALRRNFQQRLGLARALALKPEVLLLDNPLTGLDPRDSAWWLGFLDQLAAGHPVMGGRPLTLAVTGDNLRPWRDRARQFAVLGNEGFATLGGRADLAAHHDPLVHELFRTEMLTA
jgi:ABC-type transporter Mla maintaining outer membrane lipid asymmetry ATPase subunit MlaF